MDSLNNQSFELLYISRKHPPTIGGMQRLSYELRQALAKLIPIKVITWGYSQKWLPVFIGYAFCRATISLLANPRIKVIFVGDPVLAPLGLILKLLFHKPILVTVHGLDIAYPHPIYQIFVLRCLKQLDQFVCISQATRKLAIQYGLNPENCSVIPVGLDSSRYPPPDDHTRTAAKVFLSTSLQNKVVLLTVGRLVKRKGVAWFIKQVLPPLVNDYPDIHYFIVGDGPEKKALEYLIQTLALDDYVTLLGSVNDAKLQRLYQETDIFIMPNIAIEGDFEGFGIVAIEAAVNEACVVAANLEGIRDAIIHQKNGLLLPSKDAIAFKTVIKQLIEDGTMRRNLSQQARKFTQKHYNWATIAQSYANLIHKMGNKASYASTD